MANSGKLEKASMGKTVTILNGSTRAGGNTDIILQALIKGVGASGAKATELYLRRLRIADCVGCCQCRSERRCRFDDGMTLVRASIEMADLIVFASPVYWREITGLLKTCFDRLYFYHHKENCYLLEGKQAAIVTTMGVKEQIEEEAELINEFYRRALGSMKIRISASRIYSDLMEYDSIVEKPEYLSDAFELGVSL